MLFGGMYSSEQLETFRAKDLRIHKSGIVGSYIKFKGELPSKELLDEAIKLIYQDSEQDKKIIKDESITGEPF